MVGLALSLFEEVILNEYGMILLYFAGAMAFMCVVGFFALRYVRAMAKLPQERYEEKERLLKILVDTLNADDIERYKRLPNHDSRRAWLQENRLDLMDRMPEAVIAQHVDVRLLHFDEALWSEAEMVQRYLGYCESVSLLAYQEDLDAYTLWVRRNRHLDSGREKLSAELWGSLTEENRRQFKRARTISERKRILSEAIPDSSSYQTDYLFPTMINTFLGIDSSDSSYFGGSDAGGGGDSGGGDGGGGGGGGD